MLARLLPYGLIWSNMVRHDLILFGMDRYGQVSSRIVRYGPVESLTASGGYIWRECAYHDPDPNTNPNPNPNLNPNPYPNPNTDPNPNPNPNKRLDCYAMPAQSLYLFTHSASIRICSKDSWKQILILFIIIERRLEEVSSFMEQKLKGNKFKSPDIFQALGLQLVV